MSEIDELPNWAERAPGPTANVPSPEPARPGRSIKGLLPAMVGIVVLGGLAGAGYWFATRSGDDTTLGAEAASESALGQDATATTGQGDGSEATSSDGEPAAPTTVTTATTSSSAAQQSDDGDSATDGSNGSADENLDGGVRHAVFKGGQVFLRGRVPSEEFGQEIETKAGLVVGPDNVFNEYEIDPDAPAATAAPLYVEDVVLFGFNSVRIESPFLPILDLGTSLLVQNPNVTITIVTRTDAVGSEAVNLEVSGQRAEAVIDYWIRQGIDSSRLFADPRGEEEASEDDDEQAAALNRRAEFIISGLLD